MAQKKKISHGPENSTKSNRLMTGVIRKPARVRHQKGSLEPLEEAIILRPDAQQRVAEEQGKKNATRFSRTAALTRGRRRAA